MKSNRITFAAGLALSFVFMSGPSAKGLFDSITGALGSGERQERETTYLDDAQANGPDRDTCGGDGQTTLFNALVEQGLGIVKNQDLFDYLQDIAAKLVRVSPYPECRVTVFVTPHDSAQAVALADGGVLIAMGFLRNLKNEDEVAAVLAHEISHIVKNHHASDSFVASQDGFLKGLETANASGGMLLGMVDPNLQKGLDATVAVGDAVYNISESMIAPAWTVGQEDEADLLGTDLLAAAGYNPRAMAAVMDIIEVHEAAASEVEAERDKLYKQRIAGSVLDAVTNTNVNDTASVVSSVAGLTSSVFSGSDKETHRPAADRKKNVSAYIKKFHRKHRRRKFSTQAWKSKLDLGDSGQTFRLYKFAAMARRAVFSGSDYSDAAREVDASVEGAFADHAYPRLAQSEIRLKQGNRTTAIAGLEAAMQPADAPWQIFRNYADIQLAAGNFAKAAAAVNRADRRYGQPLGIAPFAIKVYSAAKDDEKVAYYMARCQESGSRAHIKICQNAAEQQASGNTEGASGSSGVGGFFGRLITGGKPPLAVGSGGEIPYDGSNSEENKSDEYGSQN